MMRLLVLVGLAPFPDSPSGDGEPVDQLVWLGAVRGQFEPLEQDGSLIREYNQTCLHRAPWYETPNRVEECQSCTTRFHPRNADHIGAVQYACRRFHSYYVRGRVI